MTRHRHTHPNTLAAPCCTAGGPWARWRIAAALLLLLSTSSARAESRDAQLLPDARARLEQVMALYNNADFEKSLAMARTYLAGHPSPPCDPATGKVMADLHRMVAANHDKLGHTEQADAAFARALAHDPTTRPPPGVNAATLKRFAALAHRLRPKQLGTLAVTVPCSRTSVAVDGKPWADGVSRASVTVGKHKVVVTSGTHTVEKEAWICLGRITDVNVVPPGTIRVEGRIAGDTLSIASPGEPAVTLERHKGKATISTSRPAGTHIVRASCSSIPHEVTVTSCKTTTLDIDDLCPSNLGKKLTYSGLALGTAAMVTAAVLYGVAVPAGDHAYDKYMAVENDQTQMNNQWADVKSAQNKIIAAHVLMGAGAAATGAALYFLITRYAGSGERPAKLEGPVPTAGLAPSRTGASLMVSGRF